MSYDLDEDILQDFLVEAGEILDENKPKWSVVRDFIFKHNLTIQEQDIYNKKTIGVTINFPGIPYAYIPIIPTKKIVNVDKGEYLGFAILRKNDIIQKTVNNRKIADFLMQLLLYSFSLWYNNKIKETKYKTKLEKINKEPAKDIKGKEFANFLASKYIQEKNFNLEMINEFIKTKLVVIPDYKYKLSTLPRRLTTNNNFFKNDKLIVDNESEKRLSYYLYYMMVKNSNLVINYNKREFLDKYYTYSTDFIQRNGQLIFINNLAIENWIESMKNQVQYLLYRYVFCLQHSR